MPRVTRAVRYETVFGRGRPMNMAHEYLAALSQVDHAPLNATTLHQAKRCLLDYVGATWAGARMADDRIAAMLDRLGDHEQSVPLLGSNRHAALLTAVLINGIASHTAELDDGVISGIIHPGAPIFSALLPFAYLHTVSEMDFLRGAVVGYEAAVRLADAIQPSHKVRGYHATATCGAVGVALGILAMLRADPEAYASALAAVLATAGGRLKVVEDGSELKPYNPAHAAVSGTMAATVGLAGYDGAQDSFSGPAGFFAQMTDHLSLPNLLGEREPALAIERVYMKPYAACRYCHPAIEAALTIRRAHTPDLDAIRTVRVRTFELAVAHHDHTVVDGVASAKMGIPFGVAISLVTGSAGIDTYSDQWIREPQVKALMQRVQVVPDESYTALFPQQTPACVELEMNDGSLLSEECLEPKGDMNHPLSDEDLTAKVIALAGFSGLDDAAVQDLIRYVWAMPSGDIRALYDRLSACIPKRKETM